MHLEPSHTKPSPQTHIPLLDTAPLLSSHTHLPSTTFCSEVHTRGVGASFTDPSASAHFLSEAHCLSPSMCSHPRPVSTVFAGHFHPSVVLSLRLYVQDVSPGFNTGLPGGGHALVWHCFSPSTCSQPRPVSVIPSGQPQESPMGMRVVYIHLSGLRPR